MNGIAYPRLTLWLACVIVWGFSAGWLGDEGGRISHGLLALPVFYLIRKRSPKDAAWIQFCAATAWITFYPFYCWFYENNCPESSA